MKFLFQNLCYVWTSFLKYAVSFKCSWNTNNKDTILLYHLDKNICNLFVFYMEDDQCKSKSETWKIVKVLKFYWLDRCQRFQIFRSIEYPFRSSINLWWNCGVFPLGWRTKAITTDTEVSCVYQEPPCKSGFVEKCVPEYSQWTLVAPIATPFSRLCGHHHCMHMDSVYR